MSEAERRAAAAYRAAGSSTIKGLHYAICARMEAVASAFWGMETRAGVGAPRVIDGYLPPKTSDAQVFPYIIVAPSNGSDSAQGAQQDSTAFVDLFLGVYGDEDDSWLDVTALIDAIRLDVAGQPVFGGGYEHVGPLTWVIPDEQKRPQWKGHVALQFRIPRPARIDAREPNQE